MSGQNISDDGVNAVSGNVTDIKDAKKAPEEVNEKMPPKRTAEQQLEQLKKRYNADRDKWVNDTNHLSDKLREMRTAAKSAMEALRSQLDGAAEQVEQTNLKFEKYLTKSMDQDEEIERLEARIQELES